MPAAGGVSGGAWAGAGGPLAMQPASAPAAKRVEALQDILCLLDEVTTTGLGPASER